jgi:hypothetical protein
MREGDQLLVAFQQSTERPLPSSLMVQANFFTTIPYIPSYGPFHMETENTQDIARTPLHTPEGNDSIIVSAV